MGFDKQYFVDEYLKNEGITVLRLPPYYCELNPIEFIWAQVKRRLTKNNINPIKMADPKGFIEKAIGEIGPTEWKNCVQHVVSKVEAKYSFQMMSDPTNLKFTVNTGSSDEDEDDS